MSANKVGVGNPVLYYHGGNSAGDPFAATVLEVFSGDMLTLCVRMGGNHHDKQRVHHKDSKFAKENPAQALKLGTWDYAKRPVYAEDIAQSSVADGLDNKANSEIANKPEQANKSAIDKLI